MNSRPFRGPLLPRAGAQPRRSAIRLTAFRCELTACAKALLIVIRSETEYRRLMNAAEELIDGPNTVHVAWCVGLGFSRPASGLPMRRSQPPSYE